MNLAYDDLVRCMDNMGTAASTATWQMAPWAAACVRWLQSPAGRRLLAFRRRMARRAYRADRRRRGHRR